MNIEKMVEEFIEKKALFTGYGMHEMTIPQYIELAKLVEQATLERAAKVCDAESFDSFERESRTRFAGDNETAHEHSIEKLAYAYVAKKIRALKGE